MDSLTGSIIDDKYHVLSLLGAGGLGSVFLAEQTDLSRKVAIKVLHYQSALDLEQITRFEQEAKILSTLRHQNVVGVYSVGRLDQGVPYIAMEYLDGQTLEQLQKQGGPVEWPRAVSIFIQMCEALSFAHNIGVIHRDLKPQNVMLLNRPSPDTVKILDFGLSKMTVAGETVQKLTATGAMLGSISYMSPELCYGRKADTRSDIYSLGCLMYETLAGKPPYETENPIAVIDKHINEMPKRFPSALAQKDKSFPPELEKIVFKAMQKAPADRFQSMSELKNCLESVTAGRAHELAFSNLKMGSAVVQKQTPALPLILLLVLVAAALFVAQLFLRNGTLSSKGEMPSEFGGRLAQQAKCRQYLIDAETLKANGKNHQAEISVRKAILVLGRKEAANLRNESKASADLSLLVRTAHVLKGLHPETVFPEVKVLESIAYNDRDFLHNEEFLKFSRALTRIFDFYQSSGESLLWFLESVKASAELGRLDRLQSVIEEHAEHEKNHALRLTGDYGVRQVVYTSLADGYFLSMKGNKLAAERDFEDARKFSSQHEEMSITQHCDVLFELANAEVFNKDDSKAEQELETAWSLVCDLKKEHPELAKRAADLLIRQLKRMKKPVRKELLFSSEEGKPNDESETGKLDALRSLLNPRKH